MPHGHTYHAKTDPNRQNKAPVALVSERLPDVAGIVINMTYYQKGANPILMLRTINVLPSDGAEFNMVCLIKGCDGGGFNLTPIVRKMVKDRKKIVKGSLVCRGKTDSDSKDHASVDYEINIQYKKKRR